MLIMYILILQHFVFWILFYISTLIFAFQENFINLVNVFLVKLVLSVLVLSTLLLVNAKPDGYAHSFQHFHGPVMGDEHEVTWNDDHGHHHEDYVAHPHYAFSYGVEDHHTGDYHGQKEQRDGKIRSLNGD